MKCNHQLRALFWKIILFAGIYSGICLPVCAQITVRFDVHDPTQKPEIFLVGSFNGWNPADPAFKLKDIDQTHKYIIIKINSPGKYLFKLTKGSWSKVESSATGFDIADREVEINKDTVIQATIAGWLDDYYDLSTFPDSTRMIAYWVRSSYYRDKDLDSSYKYAMAGFEFSKKMADKKSLVNSLVILAEVFETKGNSDKALELLLQAVPIAEPLNDSFVLAAINNSIGDIFKSENEYPKAKFYFHNVLKYTSENDLSGLLRPRSYLSLGEMCLNGSQLDSAAYYARKSIESFPSAGAYLLLGDIENKSGNKMLAMLNYRQAVTVGTLSTLSSSDMAEAYHRIAQELSENSQTDSAFYYARMSLSVAKQVKNPYSIASSSSLLSKLFEKKNKYDSAFFYQQIAVNTNDSLFNQEKQKQIQYLVFNEQLNKQEIAAEKEKLRSRAWIYSLIGGLAVLVLTAALLIRNNKQKKKANVLLGKQKRQIETTLSELKAMQSQLIQSEKMASLGELTAGIAHEIQNPLNFVNNFSDVNAELIDEANTEISKGNINEAKAILKDVKENEEKINHHGKRADAIVKGMLQHSRTGSGQKQPTDVNALCDEYLRLAFHGLRAKDKSFNAVTKTDFDTSIGMISIIPQDIGRVILNLINNAFYTVKERQKQNLTGYEPTVAVTTKKINAHLGKVVITVRDNGSGIPQKSLDKIFQPFFTTKPTGQGTGLGLSLSYDIVKAHGGELQVKTKEGEGSEFIIQLPG